MIRIQSLDLCPRAYAAYLEMQYGSIVRRRYEWVRAHPATMTLDNSRRQAPAQPDTGISRRRQLLDLIAAHPGCTADTLAIETGLTRNAVNFQVRRLLYDGAITVRQPSKTRRLYPA
ncbi:MAG: winged helix-turn-helix transcriptional regulator [Prochlorothrix sp.]